MKIRKYVRFGLLVIMLLAASFEVSAQFIYPEDGWWWNPDGSGHGYLMERQQDTIFISYFHYSDLGEPEWLTIVGDFVPDTGSELIIGTMTGEVMKFTGGQCIGCDYTAPIGSTSEHDAAVVTFYSNQAATLEWSQETVDIERFFWSWADSGGQLVGTWALVIVPVEGEPTTIFVNISDAKGQVRITGSAGAELGSIDLEQGEWLLSLNGVNESLPILVPETKRFFAGSVDGSSVAVMGLRIDDLPLANVAGAGTDSDGTDVGNLVGRTLSFSSSLLHIILSESCAP